MNDMNIGDVSICTSVTAYILSSELINNVAACFWVTFLTDFVRQIKYTILRL